MKNDWTVLEMLDWTTGFFDQKKIPEARLDAEVLLSHALSIKRLDLYLNFDRILNISEKEYFKALVQKRAERMPVAYILGEKEFMGFPFKVDFDVLIPRPETELLVEEVLKILNSTQDKDINIVDVFTGSGNIPISIARSFDRARIYAIDIDTKSLDYAEENACRNNVLSKIRFMQGDILKPLLLLPLKDSVDIITANPPYIKTDDLKSLEPEVLYEPRRALDGGRDGDIFYKELISQSLDYIKKDGYLVLEIDPNVEKSVKKYLEANNYTDIKITKDYQGLERIIIARRA